MADAIDAALADGLQDEEARALRTWAAMNGCQLTLDRWLQGGRSGALVGAVLENGRDGAAKRLLKIDTVDEASPADAEYTRLHNARDEAPDAYAVHLAEPVHQPVALGKGRWAMFQRIAGGGFRDGVLLSAYLEDCRRHDGRNRYPVTAFEEACVMVIRSVLTDWAGGPMLESMSVPAFLHRHLGERMQPGGKLVAIADSLTERAISIEGEPQVLNPFALMTDPDLTEGLKVHALLGRAHRDLHPGNVVLPAGRNTGGPAYWLVDLAKYRADAPLTHEVSYLLVYVVVGSFAGLSEPAREALLRYLVDEDSKDGHLLPGWLAQFVDGTRDAGLDWARQRDLTDEWRAGYLLSTVADALTILGRLSTPDSAKTWLLRLAARAGQAYLELHDGRIPDLPDTAGFAVRVNTVEDDRSWIARLCADLPTLRHQARLAGRGSAVEELVTAASLGQDRSAEFDELVRALGGPAATQRTGIPGMSGGRAQRGVEFVCEGSCGRIERRVPSGPEPRCHLRDRSMGQQIR